jgi:hypothetical protein
MSRRSYLGTKSYHPSKQKNQAKVWEAEESARHQSEREAERRATLEKEKKEFQTAADDDDWAARQSVSFLYQAPPG